MTDPSAFTVAPDFPPPSDADIASALTVLIEIFEDVGSFAPDAIRGAAIRAHDTLFKLSASYRAAERERDAARANALEEAAKVCEAIADDRFREHGSTEPDTNASYYQGSQAEFYEAQDEENENCVTAIRAIKQRS